MDINVEFANPAQESFYYDNHRNQCFSGGFNNGKTFAGCFKATTLLLTFSNYRMIIARQKYVDLKRTTMQSFFKALPTEMVATHNEQDGLTQLKNSSQVWWMHLDKVDESSLRGIEPNSILTDQAEETDEKTYDILDSRVGRWDGAIVPDYLLQANPNWPKSPQGKHIVPSYHMLLANPDTQYHYIYRKYHPESIDRDSDYFYVEGQWDPKLGSYETYKKAIQRDPEWVNKYVKGQWGLSAAQIHYVPSSSIIEPTDELLERIRTRGNLFRVLDHGDASPTCCLWVAALDGVYIFYREYYSPGKVISHHRQAIADLSGDEKYSGNYADPQIFKKTSQKDGGFWTTAKEYISNDLDAPALAWIPADNNEFATRNRINELLKLSDKTKHPVSGLYGAPKIYFVKSTPDYPHGCKEAIRQISAQRRESLGTIDGKTIYSDERDRSVVDHAYDCERYFVAMHGSQPAKIKPPVRRNSFAYYNALMKAKQLRGFVPGSSVQ